MESSPWEAGRWIALVNFVPLILGLVRANDGEEVIVA